MKTISIYSGPVNENWFPASYSTGTFKESMGRYLVDQYKIKLKDGLEFTTPEKYYTDMASVPRIFWALFPPIGVDDLAFVVHDYLCWKKLTKSHVEAAEIMKFIQLKLGAPKFRAQCMYLAVKYFGPKWSN